MGPAGPKGSRVIKNLFYLEINYRNFWNKRRSKSGKETSSPNFSSNIKRIWVN